jgi:Tfp pilus assembly PilM family ATPase
MVRSIGIDPGDQAVKVVELDGSYRKTRLLRVHAVPTPAAADGAVRVELVAEAVHTARTEGMRGEATLGHPCREAVLRTIELPFKGTDAIRKVVKAEIEGEIQSQSVDDMVVDFHEIGEGPTGGSRILVASVPKAGLRAQLAALSAHGIEPDTVDLDTMALWRVAHWAGAFDAADDDGDAGGGKRVTAVVDLGARSVKVVLVEGDNLVEMRALRLGDAFVAEQVARDHGIDAITARDAVQRALASGSDQRVQVADELPAPAADTEMVLVDDDDRTGADAGPAATDAPTRTVVVHHAAVDAAYGAFLQRLARELTRFLTASGRDGQLRAVWVTGGAVRQRGMLERLTEVFGVQTHELDVLGRLQHDLPAEQVEELGPRLATAVGLALGRLGGPSGFQLRQEDLVLTRGFERVKFPLAIACMVGLLAMFVWWNKKQIELKNLELEIGSTYVDKKDPKAPLQFYGMLYSVVTQDGWFAKPDQFRLEAQRGKDYTHKELLAELDAKPVHQRLQIVRDRLKSVADAKQKESGIYEDVSIESGLAVLVRWAELIRATEPQLGKFVVTKIDLNMKPPNRRLEFTIAFRGEEFRSRRESLRNAIDEEIKRPDSPFEVSAKAEQEKPAALFANSAETGVTGAYYTITMHVKDVFAPFGPSAGN